MRSHGELVLPSEVWNPTFSLFRDWVQPATEAPEEYTFGTALAVVGLAIGRDAYVQIGRRVYANEYVCLLGSAGLKKGTPFALVHDEIVVPHIDDGLGMKVVRGTGSAEGLLEAFMEEVTEKDKNGKTQKILKPVPERCVITIEEELGYLLKKAHSDATANLREMNCQLWDGVNIAPPTRSRSLRVERPFYSVLSMTTAETLEARLEEDDILSGLLPRFIFFKGSMRPPLAWPQPPSEAGAKALAQALEGIRGHARRLRKSGKECLQPADSIRTAWEKVYTSLRRRAVEAPTPAIGRMLARIDTHILKAALSYAICSGHSQIEQDDLGHALTLGEYLSETAVEVASTQMGSDVRRVEYKIMALLDHNPGVWVRVRDLQQRLSGRVDANRFHMALKALIKLDRLETDPPDECERPKLLRARVEGGDRLNVDAGVDGSRT